MRFFLKYTLTGILLLTVFAGCKKDYESIEQVDDRNVKAYIQQNNLTGMVQYENSGIYTQVLNSGVLAGSDLKYSDRVPLVFTVRSLDGKFAEVDTFNVNNRYIGLLGYFVPDGVRIGVKEVLKKAGGSIRIIIPSRLAFGRNGNGNIPGNASLDFIVSAIDTNKLKQYDDVSINKYLQANSLSGFTKSATGLYYKISNPGTGSPITIDSTVSAEYTGKFFNGVVFDKADVGKAVSFPLMGVIKGWQQAIPLLKQGGSIRLVIPSALAYGTVGSTGIPPFSCLDFDIKITDVSK
jgi:FKBP-type peptidyl-prolyl cis-trans isomerase FkpA